MASDPSLDNESAGVYRDVKMYPFNTQKRGDMLVQALDDLSRLPGVDAAQVT